MFCENCGARIEDGSLFCENCGAKVSTEESAVQTVVTSQPMQQTSQTQQQQAVMQQKVPMTKGRKILIAEIVILVLAVVGVYKLGENLTSPQTVAENYFEAESAGSTDELYAMMDLPDSPLLSYEIFVKTMENNNLLKFTNYKVKEYKDDSLLGALEGTSKENRDEITKTFICEYIASGQSDSSTEQIKLVKQKEKKWFLFDAWNVSPNQLVTDYQISAPGLAELTLNGMRLSEIAVAKEEQDYGDFVYTLPIAFPGDYDITVEMPCCETIEKTINIGSSYGASMMDDVVLTEEASASLSENMAGITQAYFADSLSGKDFASFLADTATKWTEDATDNMKCEYERMVSEFEGSDYYQYSSIQLSDMKTKLNYVSINENGNLTADMEMNCDMVVNGENIRRDWWTDEITTEPDTYETNKGGSFQYELVDDEWTVISANIW